MNSNTNMTSPAHMLHCTNFMTEGLHVVPINNSNKMLKSNCINFSFVV